MCGTWGLGTFDEGKKYSASKTDELEAREK